MAMGTTAINEVVTMQYLHRGQCLFPKGTTSIPAASYETCRCLSYLINLLTLLFSHCLK